MGDLADVYDRTRQDLGELVLGLAGDELDKHVPATPEWRIRDVVAHLAGVAKGAMSGDFPRDFFNTYGDELGVRRLNEWTADHLTERADRSIQEILDEWEGHTKELTSMIRGDVPMPENAPPFAERVVLTDLAAHQQDIFGALGVVKGRESAPVKIGASSYIGLMDFRLQRAGTPALRVDSGERSWTIGGEEPKTSVRASRFELFRSLSGRRSPDQIKEYEWSGEPDGFIEYFYPYGIRKDALVE
jgi:uncharacterized protein (TIGR03083 family)